MLTQEEKNAIVLAFLEGQQTDGRLTKTAERLNKNNPWGVACFSVHQTVSEIIILADGEVVFKIVTSQ